MLEAVRLQRSGLKRPLDSPAEYLAILEKCRFIKTVTMLSPHEQEL